MTFSLTENPATEDWEGPDALIEVGTEDLPPKKKQPTVEEIKKLEEKFKKEEESPDESEDEGSGDEYVAETAGKRAKAGKVRCALRYLLATGDLISDLLFDYPAAHLPEA